MADKDTPEAPQEAEVPRIPERPIRQVPQVPQGTLPAPEAEAEAETADFFPANGQGAGALPEPEAPDEPGVKTAGPAESDPDDTVRTTREALAGPQDTRYVRTAEPLLGPLETTLRK